MEHLSDFIIHHWALCLAFFILLMCIVIYELKMYQAQSKQLSPQEAVLLINQHQACVMDMRDPDLFSKGHILDAIQVRVDDHANAKFKKHKEKPVILVCQKGTSARQAASVWMNAGYKHVHVLAGGVDAWKEAGFPIVK